MMTLFFMLFFFYPKSNFLSYSDIDIAVIGKWDDGELPQLTLKKALIEKEMAIQGTIKAYTLRSVEVIINYIH